MLYLIFGKKNKGQKGPYTVSKMIKAYTQSFGKNDICVCLPGFMSKSVESINNFAKELAINNSMYFTEGMNGKSLLFDKIKNVFKTVQKTNNDVFNHQNRFTFKAKGKDHSKMIFFLDEKSDKDNIIVKALLVGSSNQSYSTYFANKSYGEADILVIDKHTVEYFSEKCIDDLDVVNMFHESDLADNEIVISKEISKSNNNFLLDIFNECVEIENI